MVCWQVPVITSASFMRLSSVTESSPRFSSSSISTMATRGGAARGARICQAVTSVAGRCSARRALSWRAGQISLMHRLGFGLA